MNEATFEETLRQLDIVFVIDTTGSMAPCINQVQKQLKHFARTIAGASTRPDAAFGVVAYRDHPPEDSTYVTRVSPISRHLAQVQQALNNLHADGGGDEPEAVMDGVWDALQKSQWRASSYKAIVLVGDAPAHRRCPRELTFDQIIKEARRHQVPIFAVGASKSSEMTKQFKLLADGTGGLFVRLDDISTLIEKILSLLKKTVIVDMEISLAVYNRRMAGLSASEIANQIGRSTSEVTAIIRNLEAKGARWAKTTPITPAPRPSKDVAQTPASTKSQTPVVGTIPIGIPTSESPQPVGGPTIVPIANFAAQPTYQVRWMGWQGVQKYELQEARNVSFTGAKTVYSGANTSWTAQDQPAGTFFYRVRMCDAIGHWGGWSETQSTVVS